MFFNIAFLTDRKYLLIKQYPGLVLTCSSTQNVQFLKYIMSYFHLLSKKKGRNPPSFFCIVGTNFF